MLYRGEPAGVGACAYCARANCPNGAIPRFRHRCLSVSASRNGLLSFTHILPASFRSTRAPLRHIDAFYFHSITSSREIPSIRMESTTRRVMVVRKIVSFFVWKCKRVLFFFYGKNGFIRLCKFNLPAISRVVMRRFASTNAFIWCSSASTGLAERGATFRSKLQERNFENQF